MTDKKALIWRFSIASAALLAAIAVYCFARSYPPEFLESFKATNLVLAAEPGLFGSAPSFFYTISIGLLVGICSSTPNSARLHCLLWIGASLFLELSQHPIVAEPLVTLLASTLSESTWKLIGPYWTSGTFDQLDILALVIGGSIALALLTYLPGEQSDES
jgi:hypothetical protein